MCLRTWMHMYFHNHNAVEKSTPKEKKKQATCEFSQNTDNQEYKEGKLATWISKCHNQQISTYKPVHRIVTALAKGLRKFINIRVNNKGSTNLNAGNMIESLLLVIITLDLIKLICLDDGIGFRYRTLSSSLVIKLTIMLVRISVSSAEQISTPTVETSQSNTLTACKTSTWTRFLRLGRLFEA